MENKYHEPWNQAQRGLTPETERTLHPMLYTSSCPPAHVSEEVPEAQEKEVEAGAGWGPPGRADGTCCGPQRTAAVSRAARPTSRGRRLRPRVPGDGAGRRGPGAPTWARLCSPPSGVGRRWRVTPASPLRKLMDAGRQSRPPAPSPHPPAVGAAVTSPLQSLGVHDMSSWRKTGRGGQPRCW